jgi:hypothetical protein
MKLVHQCPSCLFSSSTEELPSEIDNSKGRKGPRNRIFGSLKEFAQFIFCDGDKNLTNRDYYTKFYTISNVNIKSKSANHLIGSVMFANASQVAKLMRSKVSVEGHLKSFPVK